MEVPSHREPELSESQARRPSALKSALGPRTDLLDDPRVVEVTRTRRRRRLFVFRTLDVDDAFAVAVPGVRPRVQLLLELRTAGRIRLARSLFAYLVRMGRDPSAVPDAFYVRVGAVLAGRLPAHKILPPLLHSTRQPCIEPPANCTSGRVLERADR